MRATPTVRDDTVRRDGGRGRERAGDELPPEDDLPRGRARARARVSAARRARAAVPGVPARLRARPVRRPPRGAAGAATARRDPRHARHREPRERGARLRGADVRRRGARRVERAARSDPRAPGARRAVVRDAAAREAAALHERPREGAHRAHPIGGLLRQRALVPVRHDRLRRRRAVGADRAGVRALSPHRLRSHRGARRAARAAALGAAHRRRGAPDPQDAQRLRARAAHGQHRPRRALCDGPSHRGHPPRGADRRRHGHARVRAVHGLRDGPLARDVDGDPRLARPRNAHRRHRGDGRRAGDRRDGHHAAHRRSLGRSRAARGHPHDDGRGLALRFPRRAPRRPARAPSRRSSCSAR